MEKIFKILVYEAIWLPWLEHDFAWESFFSKILQLMSRIFELDLGILDYSGVYLNVASRFLKNKVMKKQKDFQ